MTARRGALSPERVRRKTRRKQKQYSQLFLCSHNARIFLHIYFDSSKMRLSGLTRSGERMAEFPANNQRHLFASIVLAFGLRGRFFILFSIPSDEWGERPGALEHSCSLDEGGSVHLGDRSNGQIGLDDQMTSVFCRNLPRAMWAVLLALVLRSRLGQWLFYSPVRVKGAWSTRAKTNRGQRGRRSQRGQI